jgi:hypothetical protein
MTINNVSLLGSPATVGDPTTDHARRWPRDRLRDDVRASLERPILLRPNSYYRSDRRTVSNDSAGTSR